MPGVGHELKQTIMTTASWEQQGITLLALKDLLDAVANAPVGSIHVASNDEQNRNRQVVMGDVCHPEAAGYRIQATLKGEEIAVGSPVTGKESTDALLNTGIQLTQQILI